jgi:threonylcarbamoyladenosine tRNA methylthiotransferase MtaB
MHIISGNKPINENSEQETPKLRRKTISLMTLGCKVNQYETEAMSELFANKGYEILPSEARADYYVINTCSVTNLGEKKSRQYIRKMKRQNPNAIIAVVGCYSQVATDEVMNIEGVNLVLGTNERSRIVEYMEELEPWDKVSYVGDIMQVREFEELQIDHVTDKTRAFIKIQEGCNQFCSYCIIPYARGPIRSRQPEQVIKEVKRLVENGFKEIVLTGIHIASYGKDFGNIELIDLIKQVHEIEGLERIRLGSLEPRLLSEDFIKTIQTMEKFCPHFHLSLQSGSDTVLKRMNRKYDAPTYLETVEAIKSAFDAPSFTTDVIVGFPGETDAEFEETMAFVSKVGFAKIHVFQYSPKKGTPAADMGCQVNGDVKHTRSERLIALSDQMEQAYYESLIGKTFTVLLEGLSTSNDEYMEGLSERYVRVFVPKDETLIGTLQKVNFQSVKGDIVYGVRV